MRRNTSLFVFLLALSACGLGAMAGCGDDEKPATPAEGNDGGSTTDGPGPGTDGGNPGNDGGGGDASNTDAADAGLLFTDYVKDLIQNHTADNTTPDDPYAHTFLPDPEDPSAFPASFF